MKRIIILLTCVFATVLALTSCGKEYKPVKSTKEEAKVIYTMKIDGVTYEVKYELYRALFLNNKHLVDGGDNSVWSSANKSEYVAKIDKIIKERAAEIYSVFAFARKLNINPYSIAVNDAIYDNICASVEKHGSYEKFLESLKARNMNYAVMELLLRYNVVTELVYEKYNGATDELIGELPGEIEIKREDVLAYYESGDCARVLQMVSQEPEKMAAHRTAIINKGKEEVSIARYIINNSTALATDCIVDNKASGVIVGKYAYNTHIFSEYAGAVFALAEGETSSVIEVDGRDYYLAYKLLKSPEHFDRCYGMIRQSYINNEVGKKMYNARLGLLNSVELKKYSEIDHANISMN
jgi:hypothetical protein